MKRTRYTSIVSRALATCAGLAVLLCTLVPRTARAERQGVHFQLENGPSATWIPRMPSMTTNDVTVGPRTLPSQDIATGGSLWGFGWNLDTSVVFSDRYVLPLFGVSLYGAIGSYDRIRTGLDGSIASVRPWTAFTADILLPGFGYRAKHRRWMFSATARLGASVITESGSVAAGTEVTDLSLTAGTFAVFGELEACRRLDPLSRVCLMVAPRILGFGFMNGGTIGIRMELGK